MKYWTGTHAPLFYKVCAQMVALFPCFPAPEPGSLGMRLHKHVTLSQIFHHSS